MDIPSPEEEEGLLVRVISIKLRARAMGIIRVREHMEDIVTMEAVVVAVREVGGVTTTTEFSFHVGEVVSC